MPVSFMVSNPRPCNKYCELCPTVHTPANTQRRDTTDVKPVSVLPNQSGSALVRAALLCNTSGNRLSEKQSIEEEMTQRLDRWKKATVWKSWQRYLSARWSSVSCHDWKCNCKAPFTVQVKPSHNRTEISASMRSHRPQSVCSDVMTRKSSLTGSYQKLVRDTPRKNSTGRGRIPSALR